MGIQLRMMSVESPCMDADIWVTRREYSNDLGSLSPDDSSRTVAIICLCFFFKSLQYSTLELSIILAFLSFRNALR